MARFRLIDIENKPITRLPKDHPARLALIAHAECRRDCAGREIPWPGHESEAFDQSWYSTLDSKEWTFAGFVYSIISFNLILRGWITHPKALADEEIGFLKHAPRWRTLLTECRRQAVEDQNTRVIPCVDQIARFFDLFEASIRYRAEVDGFPMPTHDRGA